MIIGVLAIALIIVSVPSVLSQETENFGWNYIPSDTSTNFNAVVAENSTSAWVVGDGGVILRTTDSGLTWIEEASGVTEDLNDIDFRGVPVAVGDSGTILVRENGVWIDRSISTTKDLFSVSIAEFNNVGDASIYISGGDGSIFEGDGQTFNAQTVPVTTNLNSISFFNRTSGLAVGDGGIILGTTDGGQTWSTRDTPSGQSSTNFNDVLFVSDVRAYIVGDNGTFLRSSFQPDVGIGFSWKAWSSGTNQDLHSLSGTSVNKIWAVGSNGTVTLTKDGGGSFNQQKLETSTTSLLTGISMADSKTGFLVGQDGMIFYTETEGIATSDKPTALVFDNFFEYADYAAPQLMNGLIATMKIVVFGIVFGFMIGVTLAIFKTTKLNIPFPVGFTTGDDGLRYVKYYHFNPMKIFANLYTDLFRNTPLLVQFLFIHFGLFEIGLDFTKIFLVDNRAYISAIIALSLNSGAYQAEIIRSGIQAIPVGQMEAGRSLGLSYVQTMRYIIMPQAIRIVIPPLGNELVNLVLNSSLAFTIGYAELTRQGRLLIAITFKTFWTWGLVLLFYFAVTYTLSTLMKYVERKTKIPGLGFGGEI